MTDSILHEMTLMWNSLTKGKGPQQVSVTLGQESWDRLNAEIKPLIRVYPEGTTPPEPEAPRTLAFKSGRVKLDTSLDPSTIRMELDG